MERTSEGDSGATFAHLRIRAGYSIRSLASEAGLWPNSVVRVERGDFVLREVRDKLVGVLGPSAAPLIRVRPLRTPAPDTAVYRAREALGVSGMEVARSAGVSKDVYYRAERGQRTHPLHAKLIADALGLNVLDVFVPHAERNGQAA